MFHASIGVTGMKCSMHASTCPRAPKGRYRWASIVSTGWYAP